MTSRLRPHVVDIRHGAGDAWWAPVARARPLSDATTATALLRWRLTTWHRRRRRVAELAIVVEQFAVLLDAGCDAVTAVGWLADTGDGVVADDLAVVARWLREGESPARAMRRWAAARGCDAVGRFATTFAAGPATGIAQRLHDHADVLHRRAHDETLAALWNRCLLASSAAGLGVVVCVVHGVG